MSADLPPEFDFTLIMNNRVKHWNMFDELVKAIENGDKQIKHIMQHEMFLSAECLMCGNVFRSLKLLFNHKMLYCKGRATNVRALMHSLPCPDPKAHGLQIQEERAPDPVEYVPMADSPNAVMLKSEVEARRKAREAITNADSSQRGEEARTNGHSRSGRQGRRATPAGQAKAKSRSRLVLEKKAQLENSKELAVSPSGPNMTPGHPCHSDVPRRPRKPPVRLHSPLHAIAAKLTAKATSNSMTEEVKIELLAQGPEGQPSASGMACRKLDVGSPDDQVPINDKNSVDTSSNPAAEDYTSGAESADEVQCKDMNFSFAEQVGTSGFGNQVQDPELLDQQCSEEMACVSRCPEGSADVICDGVVSATAKEGGSAVQTEKFMEFDSANLSPIFDDSVSVRMELDLAREVVPQMLAAKQITEPQLSRSNSTSSIASGQTGSSQAALQKTRTSTRERKAPRWMQECEEEARGKGTLGNRKRSAPMDSANKKDKKGETPTKCAKKLRLDDTHSYAKPADTKIAASKPLKMLRLPCDQCSMTFANRKSLTFHARQQHSGKRSISYCHLCPNVYQYIWGLKRHLRRTHKLSEDQILVCKGLDAGAIAQLRKRLQTHSSPSKNKIVTAAQGSTCPSTAAVTRTDGCSSSAESARTVGAEAMERKRGPCPGKTDSQKPKADVQLTVVDDTPRITCKWCGRQFAREASFENHLRMCHGKKPVSSSHPKNAFPALAETETIKQMPASGEQLCEGTPAKIVSSGSFLQLGGIMTSNSGNSKKVEATKKNLASSASDLGSAVTQDSTGQAKISTNPGQTNFPKMRLIHVSPENPALPGSLKSEKVSEVGDMGMTQKEKSTRADSMEAAPTSAASSPSSASTETLRAVVNRRSRTGYRTSSFATNWNNRSTCNDDLQSGTVMVKSNEALPDPPIDDIVVEPGRKQLEIIWINKLPGQPTEKVRSNKFLVVPDTTKPKCPDTREVEKIMNNKDLECLKCGASFCNTSNLRRHAIRHLDWKRFKCRKCSFTSYNRSECHTHIKRAHAAQAMTFTSDLIIDLTLESAKKLEHRRMVTKAPATRVTKEECTESEAARPVLQAELVSPPAAAPPPLSPPSAIQLLSSPSQIPHPPPPQTPSTTPFNISTRRCQREFDTSPYRPLVPVLHVTDSSSSSTQSLSSS